MLVGGLVGGGTTAFSNAPAGSARASGGVAVSSAASTGTAGTSMADTDAPKVVILNGENPQRCVAFKVCKSLNMLALRQ